MTNPAVTIRCSDPKHPKRVVLIDTFRKVGSADDPDHLEWVGDHAQVTTHHAATAKHLSTRSTRVEEGAGGLYVVYRLHCNLCPRSVVARKERFQFALDELDTRLGGEPIELRLLAAIVSKQ